MPTIRSDIPTAMERIAQLEAVAQTDVGRGIEPIASAARGGLARAAHSIASTHEPCVAVLTGCFIPSAKPPAAETDGPPGSGMLCAALAALGVRARLFTDPLCEPVVRAAAGSAGAAVPIDVVDDDASLERLVDAYGRAGVTHVVSVERLGPGADGHVRNMRGTDVSSYTLPLYRVLARGAWRTIGIGDGGNEVGMGSLPESAFAKLDERTRASRCEVATDALIVAGVSNWGAVALGYGVGLLAGPGALDAVLPALTPERHETVLLGSVAAGGVDGVSGAHQASADGVGLQDHGRVIDALRTVALGRAEAA